MIVHRLILRRIVNVVNKVIVIQIAGLSLHLHPLKKLSTFSICKQSPITTIEVIMTQKIKIAILTDHIPLAAI